MLRFPTAPEITAEALLPPEGVLARPPIWPTRAEPAVSKKTPLSHTIFILMEWIWSGLILFYANKLASRRWTFPRARALSYLSAPPLWPLKRGVINA